MSAALKSAIHRLLDFVFQPVLRRSSSYPPPDAATQVQLMLTYRSLLADGRPLPRLDEVGFRVFSQTDEDGILLYIFSVIGTTTKRCVEICAGNGIQCCTANLIVYHGWEGLLVDGNPALVREGRKFYERNPNTATFPPKLVLSWITRDNVNQLVREHGFGGEIDLLSLDIDGMDYWVLDALTAVTPRVIVLEYNDILGPDLSWTVPYAEDFKATEFPTTNGMPDYSGASLCAFQKLLERRGYRLVGVNRYGFNAFFVRNPDGESAIPAVDIRDCFGHDKVKWGMAERFPKVKSLKWVEV